MPIAQGRIAQAASKHMPRVCPPETQTQTVLSNEPETGETESLRGVSKSDAGDSSM